MGSDLAAAEGAVDWRAALVALPVPHLVLEGGLVRWMNPAASVRLGAAPTPVELARLLEADDRADLDAALGASTAGRVVVRAVDGGGAVTLVLGAVGADGVRLAVLAEEGIATDADEVLEDAALPGLSGVDYLERVLLVLAARTGAHAAFVGQLVRDADVPTVRTVRSIRAGAVAEDFEYALPGSPCADVFEDSICLVPADVRDAYPDDALLREAGVEAYAGAPLTDRQGGVIGILVLLFDVRLAAPEAVRTLLEPAVKRAGVELERMAFEERLARSEARHRQLVENAEDGLVVQRDSEILYANPAAARVLGLDSTDTLFEVGDLVRFVAPADRPLVRRRAAERQRGAVAENHYEVDALHASGRPLRVEVTSTEIDWEGRAALQIQFHDVTERAERSERQRQGQRMESLGKLTGGIAHDFNNLLAVILGNLELIGPNLDEGDAGILHQARLAAERGADLTERLLAFARRQALSPQRVDLVELLTETQALLERVIGETIEVRIRHGTDAAAHVDPSQLQTAVINLAVNARDAMPEGGTLTLTTSRVDAATMRTRFPDAEPSPETDFVCLEVADTGSGMSDDVLRQAFEPFFTTKGARRGTGLGLSMVHGFVRQSQGQIDIDSELGDGTRVRLLLPIAAAAEAMAQAPAPAPATGEGEATRSPAGRTVLVVEDESSVREVAVAMLEGIGYRVLEAADGPAATELLEHEEIDLLLSDVVLPGGQRGPEVALRALERRPSLAVVFMSGYAETSELEEFRMAHRFSLIRKPFRLGDLRARVQEALDLREPS